jgi:predicted dienelactone hydrolase
MASRRGLVAGCAAWLAARPALAREYDPTVPGPQSKAADHIHDITVRDEARQRAIPLRIAHRASREAMPVVLFSHGLGGNRLAVSYLERRWRARGYVTVFLQHLGSDDAVGRDVAPDQRLAALRAAATGANLIARMRDVVAVLDALARWNVAGDETRLQGRMQLDRIGMAGHSFGAFTTQVVAGQRVPPGLPGSWPDPRIKSALVLSPRGPGFGGSAEAFTKVPIPWMVMTGTHDVSPFDGASDRLAVFPALPPGRKYELVLHHGEHSAFADQALPGDHLPRNPNHHRAIQALSTAFWDSTLQGKAEAAAWLDAAGPESVLEAQDRWQRK